MQSRISLLQFCVEMLIHIIFQDFLIKLNEQHLSNILHLLMHLIQKWVKIFKIISFSFLNLIQMFEWYNFFIFFFYFDNEMFLEQQISIL